MTSYCCSNCQGDVQAARKTWLTLNGDRFEKDAGYPDYEFSCENDCFQYETFGVEDLDSPEEALPRLVELGHIEVVEDMRTVNYGVKRRKVAS